MTSLKPYPSYRKTDLPWLGQIPAHWEAKPLFAVMKEKQRKNIGNRESNVLSLSYGNIVRRDVESNFGLLPESFETYQIVQPRNIILRLTDLQNDKKSLRTGQAQEKGIITSAYTCIEVSEEMDDKFSHYLLHSYDLLKVFYHLGAGVRQTMKFDDLKRLLVIVPSLKEQQAIAAYLDRQTAKIDGLIAKKERLLDLLAEQRAALISQAVTKGNARNKVQKDNGPAPWLFPLPSGWKREKLKVNSYMKGRIGYENLRSNEYTDEGPYLVSSVHFKDGRIEWDKCNHVTRERFEMSPEIILQKDDVLFMKDGALMGKLAYIDELPGEACLNSHLLVIRPQKEKYLPKFLLYVLMTDVFEAYMIEERKGTTFFGFSQESMGNFPISLPPISEQMEICNYIDRKTKQLDDLAAKAETAIERLREYRAALISSAVTGKIQVM